jgi:hypothetical protein
MNADRELAARITGYLCSGGFFNPEAMEHDKVRDLLIDCRDHLASLRSQIERVEKERDEARGPNIPAGCARVGDAVRKTRGYPFPGEVRSVFYTKAGLVRYVVEATGADYAGMLHIFDASQLAAQKAQDNG